MSIALPMTSRAQSLLRAGIDALNAKDNANARSLLNEAVQLEPQNEQAWLWLSGAVETTDERRRCLEQALAINPLSEPAKHGLKVLGPAPVAMVAAAPVASATDAILATIAQPGSTPETPAPAASVPAAMPTPINNMAANYTDWVFGRDRFLLRQKIGINEKYQVWDEYQQTLLYIERPRYFWRGLLVATGIGLVLLVMFVLGMVAASVLPEGLVQTVFLVVYMLGTFALAAALGITLSAKRHITFYRDESKQERLLQIMQDNKFYLINANYSIKDAQGNLLATLRKNHLYNMLRKRWYCYTPDGALFCVAKEDSMLRSVLRRIFGQLGAIGALVLPLLRTNFVILRGEQPVGVFNRKMTLMDRYQLDMSADPLRAVDRRIALALGVMLDTGERR